MSNNDNQENISSTFLKSLDQMPLSELRMLRHSYTKLYNSSDLNIEAYNLFNTYIILRELKEEPSIAQREIYIDNNKYNLPPQIIEHLKEDLLKPDFSVAEFLSNKVLISKSDRRKNPPQRRRRQDDDGR